MRYLIILIILLFSCSKEKIEEESLSELIKRNNIEKIEKKLFSSGDIKNFEDLKNIYNFLNRSYHHEKCNIIFKDHKVYLKKLCYDFMEFKDLTFFNEGFHKYIFKDNELLQLFFYKLEKLENMIILIGKSSKEDKKIALMCNDNIFSKFNNLDFNKLSLKGYSIFGCVTLKGQYTNWSLIKHIAKNNGDWNLKQENISVGYHGVTPPFNKRATTPFTNFINWEDVTNDMIKFAIKTGANWNIGGYYNPFSTYIKRKDFSLDNLKFAVKTGAKWNIEGENPFKVLLQKKTLNLKMIKFAIDTGAKWKINNKENLFYYLLKREDIDFEMIKYAIKTGAKWKIIKNLNPFEILLKKDNLNLKILQYAIKTGANWKIENYYNPFSDLIKNPNTTLKMLKFAIDTGATLKNITELTINQAKKEEVRDYLMKLKKESK